MVAKAQHRARLWSDRQSRLHQIDSYHLIERSGPRLYQVVSDFQVAR